MPQRLADHVQRYSAVDADIADQVAEVVDDDIFVLESCELPNLLPVVIHAAVTDLVPGPLRYKG